MVTILVVWSPYTFLLIVALSAVWTVTGITIKYLWQWIEVTTARGRRRNARRSNTLRRLNKQ